jgi:ADP-heptose:LPS heptosyltransferase
MEFEGRSIERILVVRFRALGDVILTTPLLRALRRLDPVPEVEVLVERPFAPALEGLPFVDRVWIYPARDKGLPGRGLLEIARFYRELRARRFDLVLDLMGTTRTALLARATGAPLRFGYELGSRGRLYRYTHRFPRRDPDLEGPGSLYAPSVPLQMARALGVEGEDPHPSFPEDPDRTAMAEEWLRHNLVQGAPRVGLQPFATYPAKAWPLESFQKLAAGILQELGTKPVVLWGPGDRKALSGFTPGTVIPAPETDLRELFGLLRGLDLVVGIDSGPQHLAVAAGTPTVSIFGPTDPRTWTPPSGKHRSVFVPLPCAPCHRRTCPFPDHPCMSRLEPASVLEEVLRLLPAARPGRGREVRERGPTRGTAAGGGRG